MCMVYSFSSIPTPWAKDLISEAAHPRAAGVRAIRARDENGHPKPPVLQPLQPPDCFAGANSRPSATTPEFCSHLHPATTHLAAENRRLFEFFNPAGELIKSQHALPFRRVLEDQISVAPPCGAGRISSQWRVPGTGLSGLPGVRVLVAGFSLSPSNRAAALTAFDTSPPCSSRQ